MLDNIAKKCMVIGYDIYWIIQVQEYKQYICVHRKGGN